MHLTGPFLSSDIRTTPGAGLDAPKEEAAEVMAFRRATSTRCTGSRKVIGCVEDMAGHVASLPFVFVSETE